ncbi:hypothetical protein BC940DRAFT_300674 [Gongronella butleri]|nr:hypothetical protein BC940DRAFT_300674 [Gongronella butleri]
MASHAHKALILFNKHEPTQASLPNLDSLLAKGSAGSIYLETDTGCDDILQLFGLHDAPCATDAAHGRYGHVRFGLLTADAQLVDLARGYGLTFVSLLTDDVALDDMPLDAMDALITEGLAAVDILFVDLTCSSWTRIDHLFQSRLADPDLLNCVITSAAVHSRPTQPYQPRQSFQMKLGRPVVVDQHRCYVYGCFHPTTTRRDTVTEFDTQTMQDRGAHAGILAYHFMSEICHRLGLLPKYGA